MVIRHNPKRASYFVKNSGRVMDRLIQDAGKEWMAQNAHVMACPPKPTVLLEVSGWKFFYGAATFSGNRGASAKTAGGMPGGAGGAPGGSSGVSGAVGMPGGASGMPGGAGGAVII